MGVVTSAGTKLFVGGTTASGTEAEYAALTWVEVGEITSFGEFGASFQQITHTPVGSRRTYKFKGARDDGSLQLTLGRDPSDPGQADLAEALDSDLSYNFKVELSDRPEGTGALPTRFFFPGKVMSYTANIGSADGVVQSTCQIAIDGAVIEAARTAGA